MLKRLLMTAAICLVSSTFAYSQDFFISFDENSRVDRGGVIFDGMGSTGSFFIFADENLDFNQLDLDFNNSNSNVVRFTGGRTFNAGNKFTNFDLLETNSFANGPTATDGRLSAISFFSPGQIPGNFDADFRAGANGFLLAQVDFEIVGYGSADLSFTLGDLGVVNDGVGPLDGLTFGSATLLGESQPLVCAPNILGDVNENGVVSFVDIPPFISILISGGYQEQADCDFNGAVDFFDIPEFILILMAQ